MAVPEAAVAALGASLVQFVLLIQQLGNNCIQAGAGRKEYPQRVAALEDIQKDLEATLNKYGINKETSKSFEEVVEEAQKLLQREIAKLEKRKGKGLRGAGFLVCGTIFSASVNASAERAYKRITDNLNTKRENRDGVRVLAQDLGPWLRYSDDPRYVARPGLEEKIIFALNRAESQDGVDSGGAQRYSQVVLLWGASGYGKSAVARKVALESQKEGSKFTKVVVLQCGPEMTLASKKIELLQMLGGEDYPSESQDLDSKLRVHLRRPQTLVVLDDLSQLDFLLSLHNLSNSGSGPGAQYLVTSQRQDYFQSLRPTPIPIGDLEPGNAKQVLASHAGYADQSIPKCFEKFADEMIRQAGTCPQVMTTLGAKIQSLGRDESESWSLASQNVLLHCSAEGTPLHMHGVIYAKRFVPEMQSLFNDMPEELKQLFVLTGMWRGLSISQYALRYLYRAAFPHCNRFRELVAQLKHSSLLSEGAGKYLTLHSSRKSFILKFCEVRINSLRQMLEDRRADAGSENSAVQGDEDVQNSVRDSVVYLHLDACFSKIARMQNTPSIAEETAARRAAIDIKRTTSEPIMQILIPEAHPDVEWTEELSTCANQVLLEFVNNDCLHHDGISKLLTFENSTLPITTFLKNVCLLEEAFWEKNAFEHTSSILLSMTGILRDSARAEHHPRVAFALLNLCRRCETNAAAIAHVSDMPRQLAAAITQTTNLSLQIFAGWILFYCAVSGDKEITQKLMGLPGLLPIVIDQVLIDETLWGMALLNALTLKHRDEVCNQITASSREGKPILWDDLLEGLAYRLGRDFEGFIQAESAEILLSFAKDGDTCLKILNHPGLVDKLVKSLDTDHPRVQAASAEAIGNIVRTIDSPAISLQLGAWPGLLHGLGKSLRNPQNPELQTAAAHTIASFAKHSEAFGVLLKHGTLINDLVNLLHECQDSKVQMEVARSILLLTIQAGRHKHLRGNFVNFSRLLEGMIRLLLKHEDPVLQLQAATNIFIIAGWDVQITDKTRQFGLVNSLVTLVGEWQDSEVPASPTQMLWRLTVSCLIGHTDRWGLLTCAAKSSLTATDDRTLYFLEALYGLLGWSPNQEVRQIFCEKILGRPEITDRLVEILGEIQHSYELKKLAIPLTFLIRFGGISFRDKIVSSRQCLEKLSELLSSPEASCKCAWILADLAITNDFTILDKIMTSRFLVEKLANTLTCDADLGSQQEAARALLNLAGGDEARNFPCSISEFSRLLEGLREAFLESKNEAIRDRVVRVLTEFLGTNSDDVSPPKIAPTEDSLVVDEASNQQQQQHVKRGLRKYFSCCLAAETEEPVTTRNEVVMTTESEGVDTRILLKEFTRELTELQLLSCSLPCSRLVYDRRDLRASQMSESVGSRFVSDWSEILRRWSL